MTVGWIGNGSALRSSLCGDGACPVDHPMSNLVTGALVMPSPPKTLGYTTSTDTAVIAEDGHNGVLRPHLLAIFTAAVKLMPELEPKNQPSWRNSVAHIHHFLICDLYRFIDFRAC